MTNHANSGTDSAQLLGRQLTIAFVVAYAIGALTVQLNPFAPCIPLAVYALLGFFLTRDQRNSDRFADSLYYLGFLLTLTALFLALRELPSTGDPMAVAQALGAGLSASILGLGLRVLVVQFRSTVSDQEEEARDAIEEQAAKVRQALAMLERGWVESGSVVARLNQDLETFRARIGELQENTLAAAQERQKQLLESSAKAAEAWNHEIARVRDSLAKVDLPPNLAREAFASVARELGKTAAEVTTGAASAITAVIASLTSVSEKCRVCAGALEKLNASIEATLGASGQIGDSARAMVSSIKATGSEVSAALGEITGGAAALRESIARADDGLKTTRAGTDDLTRSLQNVTHNLGNTIPVVEKLQSTMTTAADTLRRVEGDVAVASAGLLTDVRQVGTDIAKVRDATKELVNLARAELETPT